MTRGSVQVTECEYVVCRSPSGGQGDKATRKGDDLRSTRGHNIWIPSGSDAVAGKVSA